jgi:hypothetical protein
MTPPYVPVIPAKEGGATKEGYSRLSMNTLKGSSVG